MSKSVKELFEEIGSWQSIPHELGSRKIMGDRGVCESCPIANFIIKEADPKEVASVRVEGEITIVTAPDGSTTEFENPRRMKYFIGDFDAGDYPELDNSPDPDFGVEWDDEEEPDEDPWG